VWFNFAEVCADACVKAGFEGVCDGKERFAVDVVGMHMGSLSSLV
jgi:hypothetical protein